MSDTEQNKAVAYAGYRYDAEANRYVICGWPADVEKNENGKPKLEADTTVETFVVEPSAILALGVDHPVLQYVVGKGLADRISALLKDADRTMPNFLALFDAASKGLKEITINGTDFVLVPAPGTGGKPSANWLSRLLDTLAELGHDREAVEQKIRAAAGVTPTEESASAKSKMGQKAKAHIELVTQKGGKFFDKDFASTYNRLFPQTKPAGAPIEF